MLLMTSEIAFGTVVSAANIAEIGRHPDEGALRLLGVSGDDVPIL